MVSGRVDADLQVWIPVEIVQADGSIQAIEAVLDTGFDGSLCLPRTLIASLGWEPDLPVNVTMANGEKIVWDTWEGAVVWHGNSREILVFEVDQAPLLGMELLSGSQLNVQVRTGGYVLIEKL